VIDELGSGQDDFDEDRSQIRGAVDELSAPDSRARTGSSRRTNRRMFVALASATVGFIVAAGILTPARRGSVPACTRLCLESPGLPRSPFSQEGRGINARVNGEPHDRLGAARAEGSGIGDEPDHPIDRRRPCLGLRRCRVGVTKGALYHHFGSEEGLVEEVYKEAIRRHAERVVAASSSGSGRQRLQGLVRATARLYGSGTPFYRLLLRLHVEAGTPRPHLARTARRVQARQREYMAGLVAAGQVDGSICSDVEAGAVGEMVNATLQGLLVRQLEPVAHQRRATEAFARLIKAPL
jgi:AcrR family transcriptional regulator